MNGVDMEMKKKIETCEVHGQFESKNYIGGVWSKCPACSKIASEQRKADELAKEEEERIQAWNRKIKMSNIPERFRDRTLENFKAENAGQKRALSFSIDYAADFESVIKTGRSVLFCGKPGTGKTHLAAGIALAVMTGYRASVLFVTVMKAIRRIKSTWARGSEETEEEVLSLLVSPDLLILDEVGVQFGTDTEQNLIFAIINERYEKRKPTIIISNLDADGVRRYLGDRSFDRLREDGGKLIPFDWESMRGG